MKRQSVIFLVGGIAAMIVAMGIGRFAFTPILPLMMEHQLFSAIGAGYLASSNYMGYLIGAMILTFFQVKNRNLLLMIGLFVSVATTWGMGEFQTMQIWLVLRFLSGMASAVVFIIASSIALERVSPVQAGIFYSGVGLGISLTGLVVPLFILNGDWIIVWKGLGLISIVLSIISWFLLRHRQSGTSDTSTSQSKAVYGARKSLIYLILAYGLEGLGYIVTGTYLVAFAKTVSDISNITSLSWILVGIAAAPSCVVWSLLATKWGKNWTLTFSMFTQAIGIAIPVLIPSFTTVIIGAILFGVTFVGITTLTFSFAKDLYPQDNRKIIGLLTSFYGLGQVIGPLIAGPLISWYGNYTVAILGAAVTVLLGALILPLGISKSHSNFYRNQLYDEK